MMEWTHFKNCNISIDSAVSATMHIPTDDKQLNDKQPNDKQQQLIEEYSENQRDPSIPTMIGVDVIEISKQIQALKVTSVSDVTSNTDVQLSTASNVDSNMSSNSNSNSSTVSANVSATANDGHDFSYLDNGTTTMEMQTTSGSDDDVMFSGLFGGDVPEHNSGRRNDKTKKKKKTKPHDANLARSIKAKKLQQKRSHEASGVPSLCRLDQLPTEPQTGNTEYKLKLVNIGQHRLHQLTSQMKWRSTEGKGTAIYMIGVADNGTLMGLTAAELKESFDTLSQMAAAIQAKTSVRRTHIDPSNGGTAAEVTVVAIPQNQQYDDVRVALIGDAQSGKSSLASVLASDERDDGRGRARLELFRHGHEIRSGRTSSIGSTTLAFDKAGSFIPPKVYRRLFDTDNHGVDLTRVVTLYDLAGDPKYQKSTLACITGRRLDVVVLVVSASTAINEATLELLSLVVALGIKVLTVVTKIDACSKEALETVLAQITETFARLKLGGPCFINSVADIDQASKKMLSGTTMPIVLTSSVTGRNIETLRKMMTSSYISSCNNTTSMEKSLKFDKTEGAELQVQEVFQVQNSGPVVGGVVLKGEIALADKLRIGPNDAGEFYAVTVVSIQRNGHSVHSAASGELACFELSGASHNLLRSGMALISPHLAVASQSFEAEVTLLPGGTPLKPTRADTSDTREHKQPPTTSETTTTTTTAPALTSLTTTTITAPSPPPALTTSVTTTSTTPTATTTPTTATSTTTTPTATTPATPTSTPPSPRRCTSATPPATTNSDADSPTTTSTSTTTSTYAPSKSQHVLVVVGSLRHMALLTSEGSLNSEGRTRVKFTFTNKKQYVSSQQAIYFKAGQYSGAGRLL